MSRKSIKKYHTFTTIEQIDAERYKVKCDCGNTFVASLRDIKKNKFGLCSCQWRKKFKSKNTFTLSADGKYYIGTDTNENIFFFSVEDYDRVYLFTEKINVLKKILREILTNERKELAEKYKK